MLNVKKRKTGYRMAKTTNNSLSPWVDARTRLPDIGVDVVTLTCSSRYSDPELCINYVLSRQIQKASNEIITILQWSCDNDSVIFWLPINEGYENLAVTRWGQAGPDCMAVAA